MKIAIDISQIIYQGTGVANYTRELVRNLLKIDHKNQYLLIGISIRDKIFKEYYSLFTNSNNNVKLCLLPLPATINEFIWNRIHSFPIDKLIGKVDIFHSSDWVQPKVSAKKITTIHDLVVYKFPQYSHPKIIAAHKRRLYWVKKEADKVITDSNSTRSDLISILNFNPNMIEVIPPGINSSFKPVGREEISRIRKKYNLGENYILSVGTAEPRKNLKTLFTAYHLLSENNSFKIKEKNIKLVTVGKKGWGESINHEKNITALGFVSESDLPGLYCGASVFVYPSIYEGFGFPVLEAMSCQTPVITTDRGSLEEIAAGAGLLFSPEDPRSLCQHLINIFENSLLRKELIENGKKRAQTFRWELTASRIIKTYQKLYSDSRT